MWKLNFSSATGYYHLPDFKALGGRAVHVLYKNEFLYLAQNFEEKLDQPAAAAAADNLCSNLMKSDK